MKQCDSIEVWERTSFDRQRDVRSRISKKFAEITGEKTQTYIRGKRLIAMQDD